MQAPARAVHKLSAEQAEPWSRVGEGEVYVSDLIDEPRDPGAKMTVGYARVGQGEELEISFPYDEVLIVTRGSYTVRTQDGQEINVRPGEVVYLPAESVNKSYAEEDCEMVYVASPPAIYAEHVAASAQPAD